MASNPAAKINLKNAGRAIRATSIHPFVNRKIKSRDRLVSVASVFFLQGSYHGVGTAEICAAAQINKGSFYHYFPSKTDLLLEVIEMRVQEVETRIAKIAAGRASGERKILQLFTMPYNDSQQRKREAMPPGYFLGNIILELASTDPRIQSAASSALKRWSNAIEALVSTFCEEEEITNLDTRDAAAAIVGLLQGGAVMASAFEDPRKLRAFGHIALTILRS